MKDLVGQTLGHYRIEAVLGYGGMGQVFRGKHIYLGRAAAVKVMHEHLASNPTFRERFLREAKATAALRDPHIVEIYEFGEQDGLLYLVMELSTEGTLSALLRPRATEQPIPLQLIVGLDLVRQAAEGLAAAHALGMIHRDIKPDNLLLTRLSNPDRISGQYQVKISDFGLARLSESSGLTTGGPVGTPAYMSPEQTQNATLDGRSDLYSLGVVLYEVVTGYLPFQINSFSDAVQKHVNDEPFPIRQLRPDLPPIVEQIILRCLAKRPEERYQTGSELARVLQEAINDAGLETRAPLVPLVPLVPPSPPRPQTPSTVQAQGAVPKKRLLIPNWLFPGLAALLAVALVLAIVIPRGGNPSGVETASISTPRVTSTSTSTALPTFKPIQLYNAVTSRPPFYSSALSQQDDANWDQGNQCRFAGGVYEVTATPGVTSGVTVCLEQKYTFSDFAFQAQMTIRSANNNGEGGGLVFRGMSVTDAIYRLRIGLDGSYDIFHGNLIGPAGSAVSGPVLNQKMLLTVIAQGNLIFLYVNNRFIATSYSTFSNQGQLGFMAFAKDQSVDITFANVKVWKL
jgi:tRNA A-37 threonylcarbamoyl transferase component Bud32